MKLSKLWPFGNQSSLSHQDSLGISGEREAAMRRIASLCQQHVGTDSLLIGVSGPAGREGASLVSAGLAASFAVQTGKRVVCIDGHIAAANRDASPPGLSNWILEGGDIDRYFHASDSRAYKTLMVGNAQIPMQASVWEGFPAAIRAAADIAVCDLPSPLACPESLHLAARLDGVVMVVEAEETRWQVAQTAQRLMEGAQVRIIGVVLNKRQHFIPNSIYRLL